MKPRFLADENFELAIVDALRRRCPSIDILTHNQAHLAGKSDAEVLAFASSNHRILLTHDLHFLGQAAGAAHCGLLIVQITSIAHVLDDLQLVYAATDASEWINAISWVPL